MPTTEEFSQTKLNAPKSADSKLEDLTTYEYFNDKYDNFRKFVAEISQEHKEAMKLSAYLNILPLQEFRELIIPKLMNAIVLHDDGEELQRNTECEWVIRELLCENGFDINKLTDVQKSKAARYCILFCVLLSD